MQEYYYICKITIMIAKLVKFLEPFTQQFQCRDKEGKAVEKRPDENKDFSCNVR